MTDRIEREKPEKLRLRAKDQPWGAPAFAVTDPDGYKISTEIGE